MAYAILLLLAIWWEAGICQRVGPGLLCLELVLHHSQRDFDDRQIYISVKIEKASSMAFDQGARWLKRN